MKGNQDRGHIQFQPPGAVELTRYPPRDSVCAGFRGMLRDYADLDLSRALRVEVDEHLHHCRDCSLALARAELEVMRIRSALTGRRPGEATGPVGPASPPRTFTVSVLRRLHEQPSESRPGRGHRWWILLPAAALAIVGIRLGSGWIPDVRLPAVTVLEAVDATWSDAGRAVPATPGQERGEGLLTVGARGRADLTWNQRGAEPADIFRVEGDSRLHFGEGATFYYGGMTVQTSGDQEVQVPGARSIHLGVGRYHISAIPSDRYDSPVTLETITRVRLEVLGGQPAEIGAALGTQRRRVLEGEVAHYDGWSPVLVDRALTEERLGAALRPRPAATTAANDPGRTGVWLSRLVAPDGSDLAGATVHVISARGPDPEIVQSDREGRFTATQLEDLRGGEVVLQVTPPWPGPGVAVYGPVPRSVSRDPDADGLLLGPQQLQPERPVSGRVRDGEFRGVAGARIVPLIVDEILGLVQPLGALASWSDSEGEFALHRLPSSLEDHTSLVLLVDHEDYPPILSFALAGTVPSDHDRLLDLALETGQRGAFRNLTPGETVEVAYELPGLPRGGMVWLQLMADDTGTAAVHIPEAGRVWTSGTGDRRTDLLAVSIGPDGLVEPDASAPVRRPAVPSGEHDGLGRIRIPSGQRYGRVTGAGDHRTVVLSVVDAETDIARHDTRLFLLPADDLPVYLGRYDGITGFSAPLPRDEPARVLALGPDGSAGLLEVEPGSPGQLRIRVQTPGDAALDEASRPSLRDSRTLDVELRAVDGEFEGRVFTRRLEREGGWTLSGLVPGLYDVVDELGRKGRCRIEPGREASLTLTR